MTSVELTVCNRALQKLGMSSIKSFDDDSKHARECQLVWRSVYQSLLRQYRWGFAIKREQLPVLDEEKIEGKNQYLMPFDCLVVIDNDPEWIFEGKKIFANEPPPLSIRYISVVEDMEDCDPMFLEILATYISYELCETFSIPDSLRNTLADEKRKFIQQAKLSGVITQKPPRKRNQNDSGY